MPTMIKYDGAISPLGPFSRTTTAVKPLEDISKISNSNIYIVEDKKYLQLKLELEKLIEQWEEKQKFLIDLIPVCDKYEHKEQLKSNFRARVAQLDEDLTELREIVRNENL